MVVVIIIIVIIVIIVPCDGCGHRNDRGHRDDVGYRYCYCNRHDDCVLRDGGVLREDRGHLYYSCWYLCYHPPKCQHKFMWFEYH